MLEQPPDQKMDAAITAPRPACPYQILALDVDGTLLDSDGHLRLRTITAIQRAAAAGIRPVLCTGRRYRRARPVAEDLGLDAPLVCNSGALVKDPTDHRTLWRADFPQDVLEQVVDCFVRANQAIVSFTDLELDQPDFLTSHDPTGDPLFDEYLTLNREYLGRLDSSWRAGRLSGDHFHVCGIGDRGEMLRFEQLVRESVGGRVKTFVQKSPRYSGTMCEVLRDDANKWSALCHLARLWGISTSAICAIGDDMNDIPMLEGAGLGVAMGHAVEAVRECADLVVADHDQDGVAWLIEEVLLV